MMQALGYKDLLSNGYGRCGNNAPSTPTAPTTSSQTPATSPTTGNATPNSFTYKSSVEVSFSSDAMQMAYSQKTEVSYSFSNAVNDVSRTSPAQSMQSPETSAQNILKHVEDRLKAQKADGASPDELKKTLDDGLKGYQTGLGQAVDILKGYGMYDGTIKAGVEKTSDLVSKGLDALSKTYLGTGATSDATDPVSTDPVSTEPAATTPADSAPTTIPATSTPITPASTTPTTTTPTTTTPTTTTPTTTTPTTTTPTTTTSTTPSASGYRAQLANKQTLDLTVKTLDGDTVKISLSALQKMQADGSQSIKGSNSDSSLFKVDGSLDDDEKAALYDLVGNVMDLADSFYGGDMAAAVDKASHLSLDPSELASMSLNMTQTQYVRASSTYRDVAGYGADGNNTQAPQASNGASSKASTSAGSSLSGLADYVKNLRDLINKAANIKDPKDFINDLFAATFAQLDAGAQKQSAQGLDGTDSLHRQIVDGALAAPQSQSQSQSGSQSDQETPQAVAA